MTENKIEIEKDVKVNGNVKVHGTSLTGAIEISLFSMMLGCMLFKGCVSRDLEKKLENINDTLRENQKKELIVKYEQPQSVYAQPQIYNLNVTGGPKNDTFCVIDGKRYFLKVDEIDVETFHNGK